METIIINAVKDSVLRVLPEVGDTAERVAKHLVETMQMKTTSQLKWVRESDLTDFVTVFEARQLIDTWKDIQEDLEERVPSTSTAGSSSYLAPQNRDWDFQIDWRDLYAINNKLKNKLKAGKKLKRKENLELIKRLVNQARERAPHLCRNTFIQITRDLKVKYPATFSKELTHGPLAKKSICKRMMDKYDNDKRSNKKRNIEREAPQTKAAYGCVQWRVTALPGNETLESLIDRQVKLAEHFETVRPEMWDWNYIECNMDKTYISQRNDINRQQEEIEKLRKEKIADEKSKSHKGKRRQGDQNGREMEELIDDVDQQPLELTATETIRAKWPFLFQPRCMLAHMSRLLGIDVKQNFTTFFRDGCAQQTLKFLAETSKEKKKTKKLMKKVDAAKAAGQVSPNPELAAVLSLLLQRFKEQKSAMYLIIDASARENDIPRLYKIPTTPCLMIAGKSILEYEEIYFSMDKTILGTAEDLLQGLCLLFGAYYVFNLTYHSEAQITLEYVQRSMAQLNPPRLNKRPNRQAGGKFSSCKVHGALSKFFNEFDEYLAENMSSEESEVD